jgi:hypothetical protein
MKIRCPPDPQLYGEPTSKRAAVFRPPQRKPLVKWLNPLHILRLPSFGSFDHVELNLLSFLQAAEASRLDGREMYEYILAVLAADKSIALGVVKPLYCSLFCHDVAVPLCWRLRRVQRSALHFQGGHATTAGDSGNCKKPQKIKRSQILPETESLKP